MNKYDIVTAKDLSRLIAEVNKRCEDGWKPIGGFAVMPYKIEAGMYSSENMYYQPIYKESNVL